MRGDILNADGDNGILASMESQVKNILQNTQSYEATKTTESTIDPPKIVPSTEVLPIVKTELPVLVDTIKPIIENEEIPVTENINVASTTKPEDKNFTYMLIGLGILTVAIFGFAIIKNKK